MPSSPEQPTANDKPQRSRRTLRRRESQQAKDRLLEPHTSVQCSVDVAELIEKAGGVDAVAAELGRSRRTAQRWAGHRPSGVSGYGAVYHDLRNRLQAGEWRVGDKLPSIAELQAHYDIRSLNTIRSAQAVLVEDGLIQTQKGVGAFVIALPDEAISAPTLDSIFEKVRRARHLLSEIESDLHDLGRSSTT